MVGIVANAIKAIETQYKGYRFRSRLEARYAVMFDALGLKWEYEKEGYQLSTGWYLPDFWLPDLNLFIEIKPNDGNAWEHKSGIVQWSNEAEDYVFVMDVVVCRGMPGDHLIDVMIDGLSDCSFVECAECGSIGLGAMCGKSTWGRFSCKCVNPNLRHGNKDGWKFNMSSKLISAYIAARSARFEHGEKGWPQ